MLRCTAVIRTYLAMVVLAMMAASSADAQLTDEQHFDLNNLQHELTVCGIFFEFSKEGFRADKYPDRAASAAKAEKLREELFFAAFRIGRLIGMTDEAMEARSKLGIKDMSEMLAGSWANYSLLLEEYLEPCSELARSYADRFEAAVE